MTLKVRLEDWQNTKLAAPRLVQQMWETHVLVDLQAYVSFCYYQSGTAHALIAYHRSSENDTTNKQHAMVDQTLVALKLLFEEEYDKTIWNFSGMMAVVPAERTIEKDCPDPARSLWEDNESPVIPESSVSNSGMKYKPSMKKKKNKKPAVTRASVGRNEAKDSSPHALGRETPHRLSPELSAVVGGCRYLSRPQVTKALWHYIQAHQLQDLSDVRVIHCDASFRAIMNGRQRVTMYEMAREIKTHILERVDCTYADEK